MRDGTVYFLTDYTLTTDVTVEFTGATPLSFTLNKGTWFCNQLAAWTYIMLRHLEVTGSDCLITFIDREGTGYDIGTLMVEYLSADGFTISGDTANLDFGQWLSLWGYDTCGFPFTTDTSLLDCFFPDWPLRFYQKSIQHMPGLGGVQRAFAGNVGSWGKISQDTVELTVNLDRNQSYESEVWLNLWRKRWRVGKSVSMYFFEERNSGLVNGRPLLDPDSLTNRLAQELHAGGLDPEDENAVTRYNQPWISLIAQCDQLVYVQENPRNQMERVVAHKNAVSYDGPHKFQLANFGGGLARGSRQLWDIH